MLLLLPALALCGCAGFSERVATDLANRQLARQGDLTVIEGDLSLFRACLTARGGVCERSAEQPVAAAVAATPALAPIPKQLSPALASRVSALGENHPASVAQQAIEHPYVAKVTALHDQLRGLDSESVTGVAVTGSGDEQTIEMSTSLGEVQGFADQLQRAVACGGFDALSKTATAREQEAARQSPGSAEHQAARRESRTLLYIRRYIAAYFENGRFVEVEIDTSRIQQEVEAYLGREVPWLCGAPGDAGAGGCAALVQKFTAEILKGVSEQSSGQQFFLSTLGTTGFVSRDSQVSFRFPGFKVDVDPGGRDAVTVSKIDYTAVGTELVAVFLQAVFDAQEGLPAVAAATGTQLGAGNEALALPVFVPDTNNVSTADFTRIAEISNRVEAAVAATVDRVVRGVGPFSINNEAIEQLVTASISVAARKVAEKAAWCWYSCDLDTQLRAAEQRGEAEVKGLARAEAQRIKLRLRLEG